MSKYIFRKKTKCGFYDKDGKQWNYIIYTLNNDILLEQKYPYDRNFYGFNVALHIKNDYLLNNKIHRTHINPVDIYGYKEEDMSFLISKSKLGNYNIKKDKVIFLSEHIIVDPCKTDELYNADPNCEHEVIHKLSGGIACIKCTGWFCY